MKIVIDIPEDSYKATCKGWMLPPDVENVVQGIKNGTPFDTVKAKIRAEIEQLPITDTVIRLVAEVLDKYKEESEVSDADSN